MTTEATVLTPSPQENLRPFDVVRDLQPVADLIEHCFADTLGEDGQRYLRQMRSAARNARFLRWATSVSDYVSLPLTGYVWVENGQIVGNLSLIPFNADGKRIYLIANVAVHPDHRRKGIARALTEQALELAYRRRRIRHVWLHVRADNPPAVTLYSSLGFHERARRTTWKRKRGFWPEEDVNRVVVQPRRSGQWADQLAWLNRIYPPDLTWNIPINVNHMRPGLIGTAHRLLSGIQIKQWSATQDNKLLGVLSWQPARDQPDFLWLATPNGGEDIAIRALLGKARNRLSTHRRVMLDFPADVASQAFKSVGFYPEQTLIWMELGVK
jgi:ribosomal protein S18 acetylase RimI-like enzyme